MKAGRYTFHQVCLAASLSLLVGITQAGALKVTTERSQEFSTISFVNDRLSVKVEEIALRELLREIARQSGLHVMVLGPLEDRVTIEFHQLSLDKGLRRILRRQNFVVEYAAPSHDKPALKLSRPKTLWVVAKGTPKHRMQRLAVETRQAGATDDDPVDIRKWQAALRSEDVNDRVNAAEVLGKSEHPDAVLSLQSALTDEDEDVREMAIAALATIGGEAAVQALSIALYDEDVSIREDALAVFAKIGGETAIHFLVQALADEDKAIREAAAEVLAGIGGGTLEGDIRKGAASSGQGLSLPRGQEGRRRSPAPNTQQRYSKAN